MTENDRQQKRLAERNPYTPWFVVIAFVTPVVAAYALYFLGVSPPSLNNKGELYLKVLYVNTVEAVSGAIYL